MNGQADQATDSKSLAPPAFYHLLANTLVIGVTHFTVWFAVTFWVYLETRSVFATGVIAGVYLALTAACGVWFGSLVDHHRKKTMMIVSTVSSLALYALAAVLYWVSDQATFRDATSPRLWAFVVLLMTGVLLGNIRTIAMPVLVTLLVAGDRRDRANGLVGTTSGIAFLITSAISGVLVGLGGMAYVLILALIATVASIAHLVVVRVAEPDALSDGGTKRTVDLRGTLAVVRSIPGLPALIIFASLNNLLMGVFIALIDAYGLNLVTVEVWGLLWAGLSTAFIIGGLAISRWGLGSAPVRALLVANLVMWAATAVYTVSSSIVLLTVGLFVAMSLMPYAEAAEQTVLQKVVPTQRQGRVFGFAQSVELAASPIMTLVVSPFAQFVAIPFMTTGAGVDLIGDWYGTGTARGIALLITVSGIIGFVLTAFALRSRPYRLLSARYAEGADDRPADDRPGGDRTAAAAPGGAVAI
jgi:DHA3 family multidrug efflux protein-like MFS transporter